jgi:L-ribulose-5-phosphate 4-epimerase
MKDTAEIRAEMTSLLERALTLSEEAGKAIVGYLIERALGEVRVASPKKSGSAELPKTRAKMQHSENVLRYQVAAATLLLNDLGILGYSGHIAARLADPETFLIQSFQQSRSTIGPNDLLICDLDGAVVSAPAGFRPPSEVYLHCEIFRTRCDIHAIAHFHHDLTTAFTLVQGVKLQPVKNHAVRWMSGIPIHPDPSHVSTSKRGRALAKTLGVHHGLLIRAHGQVIVAESVPAVLIDSVHFVENAQAMYDAASLGPVVPLNEAEMVDFCHDFDRDKHIGKLWEYYVGRGRAGGVLPEAWAL